MPTTSVRYATAVVNRAGFANISESTISRSLGPPDGQVASTQRGVEGGDTVSALYTGYDFSSEIPEKSLIEYIDVTATIATSERFSVTSSGLLDSETVSAFEPATPSLTPIGNSARTAYTIRITPKSAKNSGILSALRTGALKIAPEFQNTKSSVQGLQVDAIGAQVAWREAKTKQLYTRRNGVWVPVDLQEVRHGGAWKDCTLYVKHQGAWKKVYGV